MHIAKEHVDRLMVLAKQEVAVEHASLREIMGAALARYLQAGPTAPARFLVPVDTQSRGGLLPGIDLCGSSALLEIE